MEKHRQKAEHLARTRQPPANRWMWEQILPHPMSETMASPLRGEGLVSDEEIDRWVEGLPWPDGWHVRTTIQCSRPADRLHPHHIRDEDQRLVLVKLVHPERAKAAGQNI